MRRSRGQFFFFFFKSIRLFPSRGARGYETEAEGSIGISGGEYAEGGFLEGGLAYCRCIWMIIEAV